MSTRAFTEIRDVEVTFAGGAMPVDAYKAAINRVQELEYNYAQNPASVADLTAGATVFTGANRYKLYSFTLTSVMAAGTYAFTFVEAVPNAEGLA